MDIFQFYALTNWEGGEIKKNEILYNNWFCVRVASWFASLFKRLAVMLPALFVSLPLIMYFVCPINLANGE